MLALYARVMVWVRNKVLVNVRISILPRVWSIVSLTLMGRFGHQIMVGFRGLGLGLGANAG